MADINVERKRPSVWPWVIGVIVLALLIWALLQLFGSDEAVLQQSLSTGAAAVGAPPLPPPPGPSFG